MIPTNNPSGVMKRLTVWPHGSFLFFTSLLRCLKTLQPSNTLTVWKLDQLSRARGLIVGRIGREEGTERFCSAQTRINRILRVAMSQPRTLTYFWAALSTATSAVG